MFIEKIYIDAVLWLIFYLISIVTTSFTFYFIGRALHRIEYSISKNIHSDILESLYRMPLNELSSSTSGEVLTYFKEADSLSKDIYGLFFGTQLFVSLTISLIYIGYSNMLILVTSILGCAAYILCCNHYSQKNKQIQKDIIIAKANYNALVDESLCGAKEVIAYNVSDWFMSKYKQSFKAYLLFIKKRMALNFKQTGLGETIKWVIVLSALAVCGYNVYNNSMLVGTLYAIYQLTSQLATQSNECFEFFTGLGSSSGNCELIQNMINRNILPARVGINGFESLKVHEVSHAYKNGSSIDHITMEINKGQTIGIVGESGSGKTTLLKLITDQLHIDSGRVLFNDTDVRHIDQNSLFNIIRIVRQDPYIVPATIRENICMGKKITDEELSAACKLTLFNSVVETSDKSYDSMVGDNGYTLSGGEKQRLAITRAILEEPEVLILDEATSALDYETEQQLFNNLFSFRRGRTNIIVTHRLKSIQDADCIYFIHRGRIIAVGKHQELMKSCSLYRSLYTLTNK